MKCRLKIFYLLISMIVIFCSTTGYGAFSVLAIGKSFASLSTKESYSDPFTHIVMPYRLYVPQNYDDSKEYQLILFLHGAGESGTDNISQIKNNKLFETLISDNYIEAYPCIVVAPQSATGWSSNELITVMNILKNLESNYNIDDERQVLTGYSMGGTGVWNMLLLYPDYFDAAVTVAGGRVYGNLESIKDIPIWIFHAQNDGTVSVECSRQMYKALTDLDANVFMSEPTTGGHNHNVVAFSSTALYDWLFSKDFKLPSKRKDNEFLTIAITVGAVAAVTAAGTTIAVIAKRRKAKIKSSDSFE